MLKAHIKHTVETLSPEDFRVEKIQTESIIVCSRCQGLGFLFREELTCYHKREYDTFRDVCYSCNGVGRTKEIETKYSLQTRRGTPIRNDLEIIKITQKEIDTLKM